MLDMPCNGAYCLKWPKTRSTFEVECSLLKNTWRNLENLLANQQRLDVGITDLGKNGNHMYEGPNGSDFSD